MVVTLTTTTPRPMARVPASSLPAKKTLNRLGASTVLRCRYDIANRSNLDKSLHRCLPQPLEENNAAQDKKPGSFIGGKRIMIFHVSEECTMIFGKKWFRNTFQPLPTDILLAIIGFCVYAPLHPTAPAAGSQPFAEFSTWMMAIVTAMMATCHRRLQVLMHQPSKKWHFEKKCKLPTTFPPQLGSCLEFPPEFFGHFHHFQVILPSILVSLVACRITSMHPRTWKLEMCQNATHRISKRCSPPFQGRNGPQGVFFYFKKKIQLQKIQLLNFTLNY